MEVLVGPTFSVDVSTPPPYGRELPQDKVSPRLFLKVEEEQEDVRTAETPGRMGSVPRSGSSDNFPEASSDSSSSIGAPGDSEEEEEEEDGVVSSSYGGHELAVGGLASLGSLEESLPIKRGLSNHYPGKSKSFANLSDVCCVKDLKKVENPFNKRRRVLMANKWKKSSFYSWQNPNSMPLLALDENDDEDPADKENQSSLSSSSSSVSVKHEDKSAGVGRPKLLEGRLKYSFKSKSCFSLADLQEQQPDQ